ncbi:MAG: hypothetical protein QXF82_00720 [Nitrososphaeria archaeon]
MGQEPKKVGRRTFLNYAIAVIATGIIVGAATYFAVPKGEVTVTAPPTTITKTITVTGTPTTTPSTTPTTTPSDPYIAAAHQCAEWVGEDTVLTQSQLIEELEFFARASAPYRGKTLLIMYEAIPPAEWEEKYLGPWFEKITGIKLKWESMSNWETILKSIEDAQTKAGIFDVIGSDQDMTGYYAYNNSALDLTEFMDKHPDLIPPHFDLEDFYCRSWYSDWRNGHLIALLAYNAIHGTVYRKDLFEDPTNQQKFKAKYGYELKTPLEYFRDAQKTGDIEDDWTIDKAIDVMEFFTRPEENLYGTITCLKPGDHMGWLTCDGMDDVFQLPSPPPSGKKPIECTGYEPITTSWGLHIENDVIYGVSKENGGALNDNKPPRDGVAMFNHWLKEMPKYSPPKGYQVDAVEQHQAFGLDGNYALFYPSYLWFTSTYNGPDSKIQGKFEYGPLPVYTPNWEKGKVRGYIDPSGWVISKYTKLPEASFLFAAFCTSKAFDLKKTLVHGTPIRLSSMNSPKWTPYDKQLGGLVTLFRETVGMQGGTDARMVFYPFFVSVAADKISEALQKGLDPEGIANSAAAAMDDWLKANGWYKKDLRKV